MSLFLQHFSNNWCQCMLHALHS